MKHGNAVRLVSTKGLSREEWLDVRNRGLGSSDAAVAVGLSPYKSPLELWLEKTNRKPADDLSANEAVFWGTTLEPVIAQVYADKTGAKVRRVNAVLQHMQYPHMLANLDRVVLHPQDGHGLLEVKTAGLWSAKHWEDGVPEHYQCQVLHQLAVTGKAWADVAVLIGGQEFRAYRIERDDAKIAALVEAEQRYWRYVQEDTPPPVDGSESSGKALTFLHPKDSGEEIDYRDSAAMNNLFDAVVRSRCQLESAEQEEQFARQRLQEAIGSASSALFSAGKATWKQVKSSTAKAGYRRFIVSVG